ncbi:outer membrane protein assembly factor BamB [uncultured Xylophilus sp.]|uniref:outer membrane protein assembly factor BamB n=1 Tax=uncultured Xylophilus sp. TaxID=296832 RepID=UPI0025F2B347|nr:outer membrane protein assembly factor BamB [uncultured Xylophilus sp.]
MSHDFRGFTQAGRALTAIVLVASLAGCSAVSGITSTVGGWFGSKRPEPAPLGPNIVKVGVRQAWAAKVGAVDFALTPQVSGSRVMLASTDGTVVALDGATGREAWRAGAGAPLSAGVGSDGALTAVVTRNNDVVAFADGRERWRTKLQAESFTAPFVAGGRVFVLAADRSVSAFDGQSGRRIWLQQRPGEALVLRHSGVLLAVGDTLVAGLSGRLAGLNPDNGSLRWEAPIASPRGTNDVERLVDLVGRVSRLDGVVCTRAFQAAVGCVDATRGQLLWTKPANGYAGVDGDDARIYGTEANGFVSSWRRADGEKAWTVENLRYRQLTAPLVLGRSVVFGDNSGNVHMLSREDGAPLNRLTTDGTAVAAAPVAVGDTLVVVTRSGGVFGFVPE